MSSHAKLTGKHQYVEFKDETIQGRVKKMVDMREAITDADDLHVRISYGNRKLDAELKVQTCPSCGKRIVTCTMCPDYIECHHCLLERVAHKENEDNSNN